MNKVSTLKSILRQIAGIQNNNFDAQLFEDQLKDVFENNGFDNDARVPGWFVLFFQAILDRKVLPKTAYNYDKINQGDVSNFLAELEAVIQLRWKDEGESIEFIAEKMNVFGIISIEDDTYQVGVVNG